MNFFEKKRNRGLLQGIIVAIPIGILFFLVWQYVVPTGFFSVSHSVQESSAFIDRILPAQRASDPYQDEEGDWVQTISGDPTYFFMHPHRHFDVVHAEIWFKNKE